MVINHRKQEKALMLSSRSIDTLIDLVENKLTDIVPFDRDDVREIKGLEACVNELRELRTGGGAAAPKRRGRPPKAAAVAA